MGRVPSLLKTCLVTSFGLGLHPWRRGRWAACRRFLVYLAVVLASPAAWHTWLIGTTLAFACVTAVALAPGPSSTGGGRTLVRSSSTKWRVPLDGPAVSASTA